jgi:S-adenosylmethionine hydrolase
MILLPSYGHGNEGEFLATFSSSGFFEIAINRGSARKELGLSTISEIRIVL